MNKQIILSLMLVAAAVSQAATNTNGAVATNNNGAVLNNNTSVNNNATLNTNSCPRDELCASCQGNACGVCVNSIAVNGICQKYVATGTGANAGANASDENCFTYDAAGCRACNSGYYLAGGRCTRITVDRCVEVSPTAPTLCIACDNGKLPLNGACNDGADCNIDRCAICKYADNSTGTTTTSNTNTNTNTNVNNNNTNTNGGVTTTVSGANAVCIVCRNNYSVTSAGTCIREPTDHCLAAVATIVANNNSDNTNSPGYVCGLCERGYFDAGNNTCESTDVQGNGVQIFATLASIFALLAFL